MDQENREVVITYETLFEFLRKEKSHDEIQELPRSFFSDVIKYLRDKREKIAAGAGKEREGLFGSRANGINIQADNAVRIIREIYDRREKKILMLAMNRARTGSSIIDTSNLLPEEKAMYDLLMKELFRFRDGILNCILNGKDPDVCYSEAYKEEDGQGKGAGRGQGSISGSGSWSRKEGVGKERVGKEGGEGGIRADTEATGMQGRGRAEKGSSSSVSRKVMILGQIPKFVGKELEEYGPFSPDDTATLPGEIADLLVRKGKARLI